MIFSLLCIVLPFRSVYTEPTVTDKEILPVLPGGRCELRHFRLRLPGPSSRNPRLPVEDLVDHSTTGLCSRGGPDREALLVDSLLLGQGDFGDHGAAEDAVRRSYRAVHLTTVTADRRRLGGAYFIVPGAGILTRLSHIGGSRPGLV